MPRHTMRADVALPMRYDDAAAPYYDTQRDAAPILRRVDDVIIDFISLITPLHNISRCRCYIYASVARHGARCAAAMFYALPLLPMLPRAARAD